jgi:putative drug exporter of the RND superfamily
MARSRFDPFNSFLRRYHKLVIVAWIIAVIVAGSQISVFFSHVSYNVGGSNFGGPTTSESQVTQGIINSEFPRSVNSSDDGIIVVVQNPQAYSSSVQSAVLGFNRTVAADPVLSKNFTGVSSVYTTEYSFLASVVPSLVAKVSQLNSSVYAMASPPITAQQSWDLASQLVANGSASSFSGSPLFKVNAAKLTSLLSSLSAGTSTLQVRAAILGVVVNDSYSEYPLVLSRSLTSNFVSADNSTMIVVYNFKAPPSTGMIAAFRTDIASSSIPAAGTYYVTGGAVLTQDISKVFGPVLGVTIVPGVLAALAIVGALLLAPLAAIVPVIVGGIAIAIALPTIYYGVAVLGHGTLTFLTPALTILLTLGLAIDYSVLQLRRTREERINGRTTEESVSISVRWAGQAVLTAGITVVVAYVVMAVANVPLFSGVGTSIAIAVSILIVAALTLLPSLELALKDRLFWPGLNRKKLVQRPKRSRLDSLSEKTIDTRIAIVVLVSALALGAFYVSQTAPSGANILKLFPDFPSNHGLTVITDELGSSATAPTSIIVTTSTPIVYGDDQFNQTLLNQIEQISSSAASVSGVASTTGPTRPYGSPFNYTGLEQLSVPVREQYLAGMLSYIGANNETASIMVGMQSDGQSQAAIDTLLKVESAVSHQPVLKGVSVYYGGETQSTYDNQSFLNGILPQVILVLAAAVYVILLIQLRSVFTPIRLIFTILCSVAFSMATLVIVYYYAQSLPILDFAPLFVVVTMLGVGIDYDIFFVTRIREEVLNGSPDRVAIRTALDKVWATIFGLGLVLATVFTSLIATRIALLGEIGFVVAAAVVIDVGIVILFFVPSLMAVAEKFNWWPTKIANRKTKTEQQTSGKSSDS